MSDFANKAGVARFRDHEGNAIDLQLVLVGNKTYALATSDLGGPSGQFGYVQMIDLSTAKGLAVPAGAVQATIIAEGAGYRYRTDGVPPTATVGMPVEPGTMLTISGSELDGFLAIETDTGCVLNVNFEG